MKSEDCIVYETLTHWVEDCGNGLFKIWRIGMTHSTLTGTVHYSNDPQRAKERAIQQCILRTETEIR